MTSRHLVDPELLPGLDMIPVFALSDDILPTINAMFQSMPQPELVTGLEERVIRSAEGHDISLMIHNRRDGPADRPLVLHIHGGGYVMGSAKTMLAGPQHMSLAADAVVVSVDYRLAPATRHPGPVEDCYAALKWAQENAGYLGIDPNRIAVAGESAGGGLAAALALLTRDRGEVHLIHQHLIYPMLDDRTCLRPTSPYAGEFVWTTDSNYFGWKALLGYEPGSGDTSPYAAAARAEDLAKLPSTYMHVGALDLFCEEDAAYARRLIHAGVPTEFHIIPGAYHGFDVVADAPVVQRIMALSMDALHRALHKAEI